jgi:hypothetical protein
VRFFISNSPEKNCGEKSLLFVHLRAPPYDTKLASHVPAFFRLYKQRVIQAPPLIQADRVKKIDEKNGAFKSTRMDRWRDHLALRALVRQV